MKKQWLTASLILFLSGAACAQTLFTYGSHKADAKDFLRAFNKNNQQPAANRATALREYLDLYINSRLKIQEAYDRKYDTLPQIQTEVDNLRSQVIENYMSDPTAIDRLTKEAFQRSQKDIHVAHIFIAFKNSSGVEDTAAARIKLNEVVGRLSKGESFTAVAKRFSDDPSAMANEGDLSWITVFTLPYEFENIVYTTPAGKYSKPFSSAAGFHIFKNLGERKAIGKIKAQQILLAIPPKATEKERQGIAHLADSLYQAIQKGADISKLAASFSNDYVGAATGGTIPEITVGQYEPAFEAALVALPNGGVSKPVLTSHGYHILKKLATSPIVSSATDRENTEVLKEKVMTDDRWKTAKDFIYAKIQNKPGFKKAPYNEAVLWALSDSLLDFKPVGIGKSMNMESTLFTIGKSTSRVADWVGYAQVNRYRANRTGRKSYGELMDEFTKNAMVQYYRDHLEEFNDDFKNQMNEFRDGNLFFEIMQQEVWNKAQGDSAALLEVYNKNKKQYDWKESAEAVIFFCADDVSCKELSEKVKKDPTAWRVALDSYREKVVADSNRYEWAQLPGLGKTTPAKGMITPLAVNPTDNTASFAYVLSVYTTPSPRSFAEARGLVMNDYQVMLEEEWTRSLRKKYPVMIDEKVLKNISK